MKKSYNIFVLILFAIIHISPCELKKLPIKSHKVISTEFTLNELKSMYDNDMSTSGAFYHATSKYVKVDFDLGANYVVEKIVATTKKEKQESDLSFVVGNLLNNEGGLLYNCSRNVTSPSNVYECIPKCRSGDSSRNGIVARKLVMSFLVRGMWSSIYELEVFGRKPNKNSDFISESRLVQPDECHLKSWLLTQKSATVKPIAHAKGTKIYLEKSYILNEIHVQFLGNMPDTLKIQLLNEKQKRKDIEVDIGKCTSLKSTFICKLSEITFPTRVVTIGSDGISHLSFRGVTVFYPTLDMQASVNLKDNLKLTCTMDQCDRSVHSDCSENAMKSGVQIACNNKQLIRVPSESNSDTFVIVDQGRVKDAWAKTKFVVESNDADQLVVSMPRTYQYFGRYQCSCMAADESTTAIHSEVTALKESQFLENLVFKTTVQYKLEENEKLPYKESADNLIIIRESALKNSYIAVKIQAFSLVSGISVTVKHPVNAIDMETLTLDTSTVANIKAFNDNPMSWSVKIYNYTVDEIFAEFLHNKDIIINYASKKYNLTQDSITRFIKINEETSKKPEMLKVETDKLISLKTVYTGVNEIKMVSHEQTCSKSFNTTVAVLHNNKCKGFDAQAVCLYPEDVVLLSIKKERNIATTYKYSLIDTASNKTLNQVKISHLLVLDEKDIKMKMRYIDISSDPSTPQITNVGVEIEFVSKVVMDYIPCGKVLLKIMEPKKDVKELILQTPKHRIFVDLTNGGVNVRVKLEIEGLTGSYETVLNIINPTTFAVNDVKMEETVKKILFWKGVDKVAEDLLVGYEVKIASTVVACNSTQVNVTTVAKADNIIGKNKYRFELDPLSKKHSLKLVVQVQPVFKNNKRGRISKLEKEIIQLKSTAIHIDNLVLSKEKSLTIEPSQTKIGCPIKSVDFVLESQNLEHVTKRITESSKLHYTIKDLVPGRKYQLTAMVQYQYGPTDNISETYAFETADEISIIQTRHIAEVNDHVNISCQADVGPSDKFRKVIEWRRADNSPLPEGVSSTTIPESPNSAFLIMDKALADFSGDYGCFVKPAASVGGAKITVIINDLNVTPKDKKVDFSKLIEPIPIKCTSSSIGEGKLVWSDSNNEEIKETENENYKIDTFITKENTIESTLVIKKPSLNTSGEYKCMKSIGQFKATQTFSLYGEEKLAIQPLTDGVSYVGGVTRLRCVGQRANKHQKVTWDAKSIVEGDKKILRTSYPNPSDPSEQDIEIVNNLALHQVSCRLLPAVNELNTPLKQTHIFKLATKIDLDGPQKVEAGQSVNLTCTGHHNKQLNVLQWIFYKKNSTNTTSTHGKIVLTSENQSDSKLYEPIKLVLSIENINGTEAGRYECKFKSEQKSEMLTKKSLSLHVNTNTKEGSLVNIQCINCPGKDAHSIHFTGDLSKLTYFLLIIISLFFRL